MRILFVTPYYYPELQFGGPPKRLHALAKQLVARGHVVSVVTFDSQARSRTDHASFDSVDVTYLPWRGWPARQLPTDLDAIRNAVAQSDILHCYGLYNLICPAAARISLKRSVPFLLEPMGMSVPAQRNVVAKKIYNATITKWLARYAAALVVTSEREAKELRPLAGKTKVVVRHNGVELSEFGQLSGGAAMRERWRIGPQEKVVGFIGRISSKKNLHGLVDAFEQAGIKEARLVIIGPISENDYAARLRTKIQACSRANDIRLDGPLYGAELLGAWDALDLFVLPSFNENFGNAAAEAVAAGVPILLTDACGIAPFIHKRAGLAVPVTVPDLTVGLKTIIDPEKQRALVARREEVKREISWDGPVAQTEELYRQIISGEPIESSPPDTRVDTR
jgi:glycosyltransferase involved in cell wall biosynthesis